LFLDWVLFFVDVGGGGGVVIMIYVV